MAEAPNFTIRANGLKTPEGPVACADGSVLLVEVLGGCLTRIAPDGSSKVIATPGGGPNGAAIGPDGRCYICNNGGLSGEDIARMSGTLPPLPESEPIVARGRIEAIDLKTGAVTVLYESCGGERLVAPNDLVFDRTGGFYFTDFGCLQRPGGEPGFLYYARTDGRTIRRVAGPLERTNGVGLSPDETELYASETHSGRVWAFQVTAPGQLTTREGPGCGGRLIFEQAGSSLDSLAVEANGAVCVTAQGGDYIARITPENGTFQRIPMPPGSGPSNICFGGAAGQTAFVTLLRAGQLISLPWPSPGLPLNYNC